MSGDKPELVFLPLGGAGEIGMNLNLYGFGPAAARRWLMIDLGVTFSDGTLPGIDVILPDPAFIAERRGDLLGIVLTHAHEDHLGAVPYLWDRLRAPIYATPFTAAVLKRKLADVPWRDEVPITVLPMGGHVRIGPFDLELITLTHSIPEPSALALRTPLGTVLHTGDWKFDPAPVVGPTADEAALAALGDEGVDALICDSTNVFEAGTSGSEAALFETLRDLMADCPGRVAVGCFASNVARLETVSRAAAAVGRSVGLAGRSLLRITEAARECGYLADVPAFLDDTECMRMPRDRVVLLCTGSQGEPRAALPRIAGGTHPAVDLDPGDMTIFSSRVIPGNEVAVGRLHNALVSRGVRVVTWKEAPVHVSGHPARDELKRMYTLARPRVAVPVHGERRHLMRHAELAREAGAAQAIVAGNGDMVRLGGGPPGIVETVHAGRLVVDGHRAGPLAAAVVRDRQRAAADGAATVVVPLDAYGRLAGEVRSALVGLTEGEDDELDGLIATAAERAIVKLGAGQRRDDGAVGEAVRIGVRRAIDQAIGKRPVTRTIVLRESYALDGEAEVRGRGRGRR